MIRHSQSRGNCPSTQSLQEWDTEGEREQRDYPSTKPHSQVFGMFSLFFFSIFFFFFFKGRQGFGGYPSQEIKAKMSLYQRKLSSSPYSLTMYPKEGTPMIEVLYLTLYLTGPGGRIDWLLSSRSLLFCSGGFCLFVLSLGIPNIKPDLLRLRRKTSCLS